MAGVHDSSPSIKDSRKFDEQAPKELAVCDTLTYTSFAPPSDQVRKLPDRQGDLERRFKSIMATNTKTAGQIVKELRSTFATGKTLSAEYRKKQLTGLKHLIEENEEQLCDALYKDLHRPKLEARMADTTYTLNEINTAISMVDTWMKPTKVSKNIVQILDKATVVKDPLGVVLVIGTWNYPIQLTLCPLVGAIAAGNCAVVKPSEISVHTTELLTELMPKYLDEESYQVFNGAVPETTEILKERFDHIFYTGNAMVGKIVMRAAAEFLTPVTLELGGKSPCLVDVANTDLPTAAHRIVWGKLLNCGQTCVAVDYILVVGQKEDRDCLVNELVSCVKEYYGEEVSESVDYARLVNNRQFDRLSAILENTKATKALGGVNMDRDQLFIEPTILTDVQDDDAVMQAEIFGPILPVLFVPTWNEAIEYVNKREKPLALYAFSDNTHNVNDVIKRTSSGAITVNDILMHMTLDTLPFGGVGQSGMGRYHGQYSFDCFTHEKSVLHRGLTGEKMLWMRYPPYTERKEYWADMVSVKRRLPFM